MPEDSMRDTISKAMEVPTDPVVADPAVVADPVVTEPVVSDPVAVSDPVKTEPATTDPVKTEPVVAKPVKAEPAKGIRPPESWKPAIRTEHWAKLPVAVQAEIHRRERQIDEGLQAASEARRGMEQVTTLFGQFQDLFEYEKQPPLQTVASLLNISKTLRFAPAPQKAQLMAQVIHGFGVDLKFLDQALSMLVTPQDPAAQAVQSQSQLIQQAIQREMAPMRELMGGLQLQRQGQQQQQELIMKSEIQTFADDPKNQYFEVVKDVMADILEAGAARGQKISLQEAYQRAILANNDLAGQYSQQQLSQAAQRASAPASQAQALAGMSVTGAPSGASVSPNSGVNLRADIEAAVARHSGRA